MEMNQYVELDFFCNIHNAQQYSYTSANNTLFNVFSSNILYIVRQTKINCQDIGSNF